MSWSLLLMFLVIVQVIMILKRPQGWHLVVGGAFAIQWMLLCLLTAIVAPMVMSAMLTIWDEWKASDSDVDAKAYDTDNLLVASMLPYRKGQEGVVSNGVLHGPVPGWEGVDIARDCGLELIAPFDAIVSGVDNGTASLKLDSLGSDGIAIGLVHGVYTVSTGDVVRRGSVVGFTDSRGISTGCHDHIVLWRSGRVANVLDMGGAEGALIMSSYNPPAGGVNCDSDCSVTASGALVADWWGVGAACIDEWTDAGVVLEIEGRRWKCIDKGGDIIRTESGGIWVDLLTVKSPYNYGDLVYDWRIVEN